MHERAGRLPRREASPWSRSSSRCVDWMRDGTVAARPGAAGRRARHRGRRRHRGRVGGGAAPGVVRPCCCSDVDNGPRATWCTRPTRRSPHARPEPAPVPRCEPAAVAAPCWSASRAGPSSSGRCARCARSVEVARATTWPCRSATTKYWLYVARMPELSCRDARRPARPRRRPDPSTRGRAPPARSTAPRSPGAPAQPASAVRVTCHPGRMTLDVGTRGRPGDEPGEASGRSSTSSLRSAATAARLPVSRRRRRHLRRGSVLDSCRPASDSGAVAGGRRRYDRTASRGRASPPTSGQPGASCVSSRPHARWLVTSGATSHDVGPNAGPVEYVEIARAESERGELVLRERRAGERAPSVLELRANGVFVMDTLEVSTERALATAGPRAGRRAARGGGRRAGARLHDARGARRLPGREGARSSRSSRRWSTGCATAPIAHGPALLADERVDRRGRRRRGRARRGRPASYDLVLLDVDNGPGYLVHDANAALYRAPFLQTARAALRPGGVLVVWSAAEAPELLRGAADGVRRRRRARRTTCCCRTATSSTGSTSRGYRRTT